MSEERRTTFEDVETEKLIQKLTDNYTAPEMLAQIEEELRRRGELPAGYVTDAEQRRTAVVSEMRPRVEVDVNAVRTMQERAAYAYVGGAIGVGNEPEWSPSWRIRYRFPHDV